MAALLAALYGTGCGSDFVTGDVGLGMFGGGGVAGSFVGATGSSSGMTVYRLIGSPIRATVTLPTPLHAYSSHIAGRRQRAGGMWFMTSGFRSEATRNPIAL